jgi:hypothetical protein
MERLTLNRAGQGVLTLKTPYRDGTTPIVMSPREFMQRLAALVPRPRLHLLRFQGVLAPTAKHRAEIIPSAPVSVDASSADHGDAPLTRRRPASAGPGCSNGCSLSTWNTMT